MRLVDGLDFVMGPVRAGMCKYESLLDGTLDLADLALMNDTMKVENENQTRMYEALKRKQQ